MINLPTEEWIIDCIKTVYDPEFPLVDIWTMGLIYHITINSYQVTSNQEDVKPSLLTTNWSWDDEGFESYGNQGQIIIDMTLTTPACPAADYLPEQARSSVEIMYPEYEVILNLVWDPTWTVAMIKDEDLKRMFE